MITLTTDFGTVDPYVGIMKGVILSTAPSAIIIDITHEIAPQDVQGAAYAIYSAYRFFPPGSIHVVVVDPGVGTHRSIIAVSMAGHLFLAPDNGVLGFILDSDKADFITTVENDRYFLNPVSRTFHGRDIFAPVAGQLSNGLAPEQLGAEIKENQVKRLGFPKPYQAENGEILGWVITVDRFGNLITNIDQQFIKNTFGAVSRRDLIISVGDCRIFGLSGAYGDAAPQSMLALIGSMGFVEISKNCGSAAAFCRESEGSIVSITVAGRR